MDVTPLNRPESKLIHFLQGVSKLHGSRPIFLQPRQFSKLIPKKVSKKYLDVNYQVIQAQKLKEKIK